MTEDTENEEPTYFVWKRNDGYIGATRDEEPRQRFPNITFEILLKTTDEDEALQKLTTERKNSDHPAHNESSCEHPQELRVSGGNGRYFCGLCQRWTDTELPGPSIGAK